MSIGHNIRMYRERLGMSQEELARKLGYRDRSTIAKIESNVNDITQSKIVAIAAALQVTPAELMGWGQTSTPTPEEPQHINIIKIAGRDGSFRERRLTDAQLAALNSLLDQLPDASDDL